MTIITEANNSTSSNFYNQFTSKIEKLCDFSYWWFERSMYLCTLHMAIIYTGFNSFRINKVGHEYEFNRFESSFETLVFSFDWSFHGFDIMWNQRIWIVLRIRFIVMICRESVNWKQKKKKHYFEFVVLFRRLVFRFARFNL